MKRTVYLILFRGVGGKTQLPTRALREELTMAGFENVATYINSGNAIVRSRMHRTKVIATIAELCRARFDYGKAIFAPTRVEWDELIARNPFAKAVTNAPTTVYAVLLEDAPKAEDSERIPAPARWKPRRLRSSEACTCTRRTVSGKVRWPRNSTNGSA